MNVSKIGEKLEYIDVYELHKIMTSNRLTDYEKMRFLKSNRNQIHQAMLTKINSSEFLDMMGTRPLIRFRPLKNSYTKWGDKVLLAKSLNISTAQVSEYIKNVTSAMQDVNKMHELPLGELDTIKTYVYRHGTSSQVVAFLDYELTHTKDFVKNLISTLNYENGSMASYFSRPIHRMSDKIFLDLWSVINKNIALNKGLLTAEQTEKLAHDALVKLYTIQYNSKFINSIKLKR